MGLASGAGPVAHTAAATACASDTDDPVGSPAVTDTSSEDTETCHEGFGSIRTSACGRCSALKSAPKKVGRCAISAQIASIALFTPVSTMRLGRPAPLAPEMSVSRRSPTTSGRAKLPRANASSMSARPGLPATTGSASVAVRNAATIDPFPGSRPRSVGRVASTLAATQ
ncbi:Uncharacterised protein [Mycobacteroides abscessus subsp. abscessus]|nr:Uncharacterised protein [Mycobacteroides abscessus subsp. abscessus]